MLNSILWGYQMVMSVAVAMHGLHVYKDIWEPIVDKMQDREIKFNNWGKPK